MTTTPTTKQDPIEIEVYEPVPDKPGYSRLHHRRSIGEVIAELNAKLDAEGMRPDEYGFDVSYYSLVDQLGVSAVGAVDARRAAEKLAWPAGRIALYPVTGGSEGHYVHLDVIPRQDTREGKPAVSIALAKTFGGWDQAVAIVGAAGRLLQA